ncbi:DUF4956 domain-containing protein [Bacteroidota bacterium]
MELFGVDIINLPDFVELLLRFTLNIVVIIIIVRYLYYNLTSRKDYLFTYFLIATTVFLLCYLLENVKLELGFALGLFAIFGIIRYRTRQIEIKEMTYLFIVIGVSVINALANKKVSYAELLFTNVTIILLTYLLEKVFFLKHESNKTINYEKIELIKPEKYPELIADLMERTGLKINRAEVGRIDFLRDSARVKIFYYASENRVNTADEEFVDDRNDDEE